MTETASKADPVAVIHRLRDAMNQHDLDAMAECFDPAYLSEQPGHPDRTFRGTEQMRKNWTHIFAGVPDLQASLLRAARDGSTVWTEWECRGTRPDGAPHLSAMVTVQGIEDGRIAWVRLYIETEQEVGAGIDSAVRRHLGAGVQA